MGIYIYPNLVGASSDSACFRGSCTDTNSGGGGGKRLYYNSYSMIVVNGEIVVQGSQFSLNEVEIVTATIHLEVVRAYPLVPSQGLQAVQSPEYRCVETPFGLSSDNDDTNYGIVTCRPRDIRYY